MRVVVVAKSTVSFNQDTIFDPATPLSARNFARELIPETL